MWAHSIVIFSKDLPLNLISTSKFLILRIYKFAFLWFAYVYYNNNFCFLSKKQNSYDYLVAWSICIVYFVLWEHFTCHAYDCNACLSLLVIIEIIVLCHIPPFLCFKWKYASYFIRYPSVGHFTYNTHKKTRTHHKKATQTKEIIRNAHTTAKILAWRLTDFRWNCTIRYALRNNMSLKHRISVRDSFFCLCILLWAVETWLILNCWCQNKFLNG